jgi:hypothetical protein
MKIVSLEAQNILRLKAVRIEPGDSNVVIIGGENKQGKTSVLEAIRMAFGGARSLPAEPIHRGAEVGSSTIDLGDLTVEFTVDADGGHVTVRDADGKKKAKPQAILDRLFSKVAFDPESFAKSKPSEQVETLKKLLGLDFSALDSERAKLYEKRTSVSSVRSDAEVRISQFPPTCVTAPDVEVSVANLLAEKEAADAINAGHARSLEKAEATRVLVSKAQEAMDRASQALEEAKMEHAMARNAVDEASPDEDTTAIVEAIKGAEATNVLVRAKKDRAKAVSAFTEKDREYAALTKQIAGIDEDKRQQLSGAKWPVPGLGFSDDGVLFNGLPFAQASQAEARIVSFAIGAELNPELRVVLIDDGEKLDKASMQQLAQLAAEKDMQVWIERVGDGDTGAVVIEDGEIANYSDEV